jgi:PAS domain S-box-containing protein
MESNKLSKTIRIDVLPRLGSAAPGIPGGAGAAAAGAQRPSPIRPEEFLRFFENAYDATLVTDEDGIFVMANRRVTDLLGYETHDLVGVTIAQLISGADSGLVETVRSTLTSERFLRISGWCVRKDGAAFPASIAANQFVSDERAYFCFYIRDETLRFNAEAELHTVQNAVHNAGTGIAVAGLDGALLYANPALSELCGLPAPGELAGRRLADFLGDGEVVQAMLDAVKSGQGALVELPLKMPDGATKWVQVSAAPNLDAENTLIGMVLSLVDIGDRRRAEQAERVVERDRVMMESLGAVCHHLGQPATVLLSSLEMLNRVKRPDPATHADLLQMSLEAAETLRKNLQELNDLRHYQAEPYPGPSADRAARIIAIEAPAPGSPEEIFR